MYDYRNSVCRRILAFKPSHSLIKLAQIRLCYPFLSLRVVFAFNDEERSVRQRPKIVGSVLKDFPRPLRLNSDKPGNRVQRVFKPIRRHCQKVQVVSELIDVKKALGGLKKT